MTQRNQLFTAIFLIFLGVWFLMDNVGFRLPNIGQLWPLFVIGGGALILTRYFQGDRADPGQVFTGLGGIGVGLFFLAFTLNVRLPVLGRMRWEDMDQFWPGLVMIGGLALIGQYVLTGFAPLRFLVTGSGLIVFALISFAFTLDFLGGIPLLSWSNWWPVVLILVGVWMLRPLLGTKVPTDSSSVEPAETEDVSSDNWD